MRKIFFYIILCLFSFSSNAQLDRFLIGVWSHSYDTVLPSYHAGISTNIGNSTEFYSLFKYYGFNTIQIEYQLMPGYENPIYASSNPSKSFLDRADSVGLKVILSAPDLYVNRRKERYVLDPYYTQYYQQRSFEGLNYYGNHPALLGFSVSDEPAYMHMNDISLYFSDIENYNPDLLRYVNILPAYADPKRFGYPGMSYQYAYPLYVENFINNTNPNILSFDYYPMYSFGKYDTAVNQLWPETFFYNLDFISEISENRNLQFVYVPNILTADRTISKKTDGTDTVTHVLRAKKMNEIRYVVYAGLMYGAKGINYWHAGEGYSTWALLSDNTKDSIRIIHSTILDNEDILFNLHYKSSFHKTNFTTMYPCDGCTENIPTHMQWYNFFNDDYTSEIFDISNPIEAQSGSSVDSLAISYLYDENGGKYFWVFNKSLRKSEDIVLNLNESCYIAEILNQSRCTQSGSIQVSLLPGEAKLYRAFIDNQYDTIKGEIVWNNNRLIGTNLIIDSLATLCVKDSLLFASTARLIIRPGGKLVVDGGTLTSACSGEMWQGIEIVGNPNKRQLAQYQGFVELKNGATIENAKCAVLTGLRNSAGEIDATTLQTAGGILKANNTTFRNNGRAVEILPYADVLGNGAIRRNACGFGHCTFVNDNNNLFAQNNCSFTEFLRFNDVNGIELYSCSFTNALPLTKFTSYRAIYTEDAGFYLTKTCPSGYIWEDCVCDESYSTYNTFSGFNTAIEANTTGSQYAIQIDQSKFSNVATAISINGNNFTTITRDSIDITQSAGNNPFRTGIYLNNCTGYLVEQNHIKGVKQQMMGSTVGIQVNNSGLANNKLYRNSFNTLNTGVLVQGNNGDVNSGLIVACADFTNVNNNIFLAANATMKSTANETINNCVSTLCNLQPFNPGILQSNGVATNNVGANNYSPLQTDQYFTMVRNAMCDTILDLNALAQLHASAQDIADPYSLVETEFQIGNVVDDVMLANNFATNNGTNADAVGANNYSPLQNDETTNYTQFHAMKTLLHANTVLANNNTPIQWRTLTESQIAELQEIAERNTGRASEMAKGVLCFFYGICYDDVETRHGTSLQDDTTTVTTKSAKSTSIINNLQQSDLHVFPNPTDGILYVELTDGADIIKMTLYDLQGRVVATTVGANNYSPLQTDNLPAGVYFLRVTGNSGNQYHKKIVKSLNH